MGYMCVGCEVTLAKKNLMDIKSLLNNNKLMVYEL